MVLMAIPDWRPTMRACVEALRPGGRFVFAVVHQAFAELRGTWREHGEYRVRRYLAEYEIVGTHGLGLPPADLGLPQRTRGTRLPPAGGRRARPRPRGGRGVEGVEAYVHLPNFLIVSAEAPR